MIIGVDIDGVIADIATSLEKELSSRNYYNYNYTDWLCTVHHCDLSDEIFGDSLFWKNLKPFQESWHQINHWWSQGHDIHLVTARRSDVSIGVLEEWLDSWKISYNRLHIAKMNSKSKILHDLKIDFMIEDNPHEALLIQKAGMRCFLMKSWYNSEYWEDLDSIGSLLDIEGAQP